MTYKWKPGFGFRGDATKVAEELEALPSQTAEIALEFAERNKNAELRKCITWDDEKAARLYRLEEIRSVIRSVVIVDEEEDREPMVYRAFEYVIDIDDVTEKPYKYFTPTRTALADPDYRKQILSQIRNDISELSQKAKTYRYLSEQEMDIVQKHLEMARDAVTV